MATLKNTQRPAIENAWAKLYTDHVLEALGPDGRARFYTVMYALSDHGWRIGGHPGTLRAQLEDAGFTVTHEAGGSWVTL